MTKPDYSEYLTPPHLVDEEVLWGEVKQYELYAALANKVIEANNLSSALEIGCGTGWVPTQLPEAVKYVGIDKNESCIQIARDKNPGVTRRFQRADIRELVSEPADVVLCFAVLKHFELAEWDAITTRVLQCGRFACFTLPVLARGESVDDGTEYPHVWISEAQLARVLSAAGHDVVESGNLAGTAEHWFITKAHQ
jgi:SAM-dependent methyltransferase